MSILHICGVSDVGCLREENQDAILAGSIIERKELQLILPQDGYYIKHYGLLCAVADGLGGHQGGAVASHLALDYLAKGKLNVNRTLLAQEFGGQLVKHIKDAHDLVLEKGQVEPEYYGMGTTLTGIFLHQNFSMFFHVGDSRLYRFRGDFLMQLTKDHTVESMTQQVTGESSAAAKSGIITNCIGGGKEVRCNPEVGEANFKEGDILLLCSDGLSDMLALENIEEIIASKKGLDSATHGLVDAAKKAGGHDNISVVLIEKQYA